MDADVSLLHEHLRGGHSEERAEGCKACEGLPPVSRPAPRPAPRNNGDASSPPTGRLCGCGCGEPVARRFKPGHDAKLKSRLLKAARKGDEEAKRNLKEWGWEHFL